MSKEDLLRKAQEEEAELEKEESDAPSEAHDEESDEESDEEGDEGSDEDNTVNASNVSDEVRRQRWFSDPMFAELQADESREAEDDDDEAAIQAMKEKQRKSMKRELPLEERLRAYSGS